ICAALKEIAQKCPDATIVYPVHPNPNVRGPVFSLLNGVANVHLVDPLDHRTFVYLMSRARVILTDSGGIQEEAPSLGIPVLVLREVTERVEAIEAGTATLVGTDVRKIVDTTAALVQNAAEYERRRRIHNPYGDGMASSRI